MTQSGTVFHGAWTGPLSVGAPVALPLFDENGRSITVEATNRLVVRSCAVLAGENAGLASLVLYFGLVSGVPAAANVVSGGRFYEGTGIVQTFPLGRYGARGHRLWVRGDVTHFFDTFITVHGEVLRT